MVPLCFARLTFAALIGSLLLVPTPFSAGAQEVRPKFKTSVAAVPITAVVRDSRNRLVRDLGRDDFHVLENSQPKRIVDFRSTDNAPLNLAVVFDTSGSMRGANLERAKTVVSDVLRALNPASDEIALFTFDKRLRQEMPFTGDFDRVWTALNSLTTWGLTSLYDAIAEASKAVADRSRPRRALIVVTDGLDTSSNLTPPQVSGIASAIDVPVYIVAVAPRSSDTTRHEAEGDLSYLARWTGGDVSRVGSAADSGRPVEALISELRQQYFLAIESASVSGWYRLDVKTKRKGLTVRARAGYFATPRGSEFER